MIVTILISLISFFQLQKNKVGNDQYMERGMNTFNEPPKVKVVQTTKITHSVSKLTDIFTYGILFFDPAARCRHHKVLPLTFCPSVHAIFV